MKFKTVLLYSCEREKELIFDRVELKELINEEDLETHEIQEIITRECPIDYPYERSSFDALSDNKYEIVVHKQVEFMGIEYKIKVKTIDIMEVEGKKFKLTEFK